MTSSKKRGWSIDQERDAVRLGAKSTDGAKGHIRQGNQILNHLMERRRESKIWEERRLDPQRESLKSG